MSSPLEAGQLAQRLRLRSTRDGQQMQGAAHDVMRFLAASGQPELESLVLGVYGALYHSGQKHVVMDLSEERAAMDRQPLRLEITPDRLTMTLLEPEAVEPSTPPADSETLSEEPDHD